MEKLYDVPPLDVLMATDEDDTAMLREAFDCGSSDDSTQADDDTRVSVDATAMDVDFFLPHCRFTGSQNQGASSPTLPSPCSPSPRQREQIVHSELIQRIGSMDHFESNHEGEPKGNQNRVRVKLPFTLSVMAGEDNVIVADPMHGNVEVSRGSYSPSSCESSGVTNAFEADQLCATPSNFDLSLRLVKRRNANR
jgi:hypothetical protein